MIKWSTNGIACLKTRPRVYTFVVQSLNNANIIGSYNHPSTCDEESLQSSYLAENIRRNCLYSMKPPQSYSFRSIFPRVCTKITPSYPFRSIYPRVCTKITPYYTHQPSLMLPRYSNVTTSICELIIRYASNNFRFIILNTTRRISKSAPRFLPDKQR